MKETRPLHRQASLASLPDVSAVYQTALLDESAMNRTQMGTRNRSYLVAVQGSPCATSRKVTVLICMLTGLGTDSTLKNM
jgi:hypothetical protein